MAPRLTRALAALRDGFDALSPGRDRASDGWIGDRAHQGRRSGHNPDDTPGSLSEYTDADSTPEVRALDVDADLVGPVTMTAAIERILATPADRSRLRYVIWQRRIASASNGWRWTAYTGPDPHTGHSHFSGNPDTDDDGRPWSVATMGDTMTDQQYPEALMRAFPWQYNGNGMPGVPARKSTLWALGATYSNSAAALAKLDAIAAVLAGTGTGDWLRGRFAEIDGRFADLARRVDQVDDDVVAQLGALDVDQLVDALAAAGVDMGELAEAAIERASGPQTAAAAPDAEVATAIAGNAAAAGDDVDQGVRHDVSGVEQAPGTVWVDGETGRVSSNGDGLTPGERAALDQR